VVVVEDALPALSTEDEALLWPDGFPGLALEHAGVIEPSLWLHFDPSSVRMDRMTADAPLRHPPYDMLPIDRPMSTASGLLASPMGSDAARGALLADRCVQHLVGIIDQEYPLLTGSLPDLERQGA
jgi:creatinine amidohydrolase